MNEQQKQAKSLKPKNHLKEKSISLPKIRTHTSNQQLASISNRINTPSQGPILQILANSNITPTSQLNSSQPKKISNQIFKTKWSISPKCIMQGHQGQQVLYLCIQPKCDRTTRLVCETCFYKEHETHNQHFLAIDQVRKGEIQRLRYWPFDFKFRKIFQFVNKHESYVSNMVQDINATFNEMAMRILSTIDKIRLNLLKSIDSFYIRETKKQKFSQKLKQDLQECFQLKKISEVVRQLFSKQIRHQIFLQKINSILNNQEVNRNRQILLKYFQNQQKGSDMFFDKMHFMKKQNWIIQQIQQQKKALKQQTVTIDQADVGIEKIVVQTIDYLNKNIGDMYPLQFDKKQLQDGSIYNGFMYHGNKTLFGMRSYKNGFVYYGQWKNNARNGWGVYENKTIVYRYAGEWKQDRKNGFGKQSTLTYVYQGNYLNDKRQGFGVFLQDGIRWQIGWKNDKKNGKGKMIDKTGIQNQIYFLNGVQSQTKIGKASPAFDLAELSKRFTSVKSVKL